MMVLLIGEGMKEQLRPNYASENCVCTDLSSLCVVLSVPSGYGMSAMLRNTYKL